MDFHFKCGYADVHGCLERNRLCRQRPGLELIQGDFETAKTTVISVRAIHECADVRQTRTWNVTPVRMVRGDSLEVTIRTTAEVAAGRPPAHVESYL